MASPPCPPFAKLPCHHCPSDGFVRQCESEAQSRHGRLVSARGALIATGITDLTGDYRLVMFNRPVTCSGEAVSIVRQWARRPVFVHGAVLSTSISTSTNTTASKPHPTWQSISCLPHSRSPAPTPHHLPRAPHQYHDRVLLEKALQTWWCTREVAGIDLTTSTTAATTTTTTITTTTPPAAVAAIAPTVDLWSIHALPPFLPPLLAFPFDHSYSCNPPSPSTS
ncbi:hypothetical protein E2C01_031913 [Portunus trituberculatus]|uniref:Uncharacterized protein n=1 Tax=Portunus trituberculatus TaxID=210409 RepID=A0A5B7EYY0_PORTR|nr:hypothetical protein [Portunus trituberculatus]